MKWLFAIGATCAILAASSLMATRADAHDVATRCTAYGCAQIVCNRTGDHCRRYDEVRDNHTRYEGRDYERGQDYGGERGWSRNCDPDNPTCRRDYRWSDEGRWWDR